MRTQWTLAAALAAVLFLPAAGAHAQAPMGLKLVPRVGWFTPLSALEEGLEFGSGAALGFAVELDLPMLPLNVRANMDYAPDAELRSTAGEKLGAGHVLAVVGDLVFRPAPTIAFARPYLLTGFGVKRYDFGPAADPEGLGAVTPPAASRFAFHAGVGVDVGDGPVALVVELGDYLSSWGRAEGTHRVQNDLFVSVGIRAGIF